MCVRERREPDGRRRRRGEECAGAGVAGGGANGESTHQNASRERPKRTTGTTGNTIGRGVTGDKPHVYGGKNDGRHLTTTTAAAAAAPGGQGQEVEWARMAEWAISSVSIGSCRAGQVPKKGGGEGEGGR